MGWGPTSTSFRFSGRQTIDVRRTWQNTFFDYNQVDSWRHRLSEARKGECSRSDECDNADLWMVVCSFVFLVHLPSCDQGDPSLAGSCPSASWPQAQAPSAHHHYTITIIIITCPFWFDPKHRYQVHYWQQCHQSQSQSLLREAVKNLLADFAR